ncbi:MAG: NDP-sugar synthase [Symbiobacterium sp.]|uniref:sugar phosphate nucleotidyltransferase n=1 Tax=Symbiobacterium sp. TaxID=1971213 RepID=UPI0034649F17
MAVRAILLAGGLGTRLHPLTVELPKPMVPVLGKPWLSRLIEQLVTFGITDITLSLRHGKEVVTNYFREPPPGVRLRFAIEPEPLGTGGAIRFAAGPDPDDTLLILNADIVQTFDFQGLLDFHRSQDAQVTIGLVEVADPSAYGAVELDMSNRVTRFVEKPRPGETESRLVNAGVYVFNPGVLSWIPEGRAVSVERETFPSLLREGVRVFGHACTGYWKDIGTRERYLQLHRDILEGRCPIAVTAPTRGPALWQADDAQVSPLARLIPPVYIGPGAIIEEGALVGPRAVVGARCVISKGARVSESVLWDGARVGAGTTVHHSVIGFATGIGGGSVENVLLAGWR